MIFKKDPYRRFKLGGAFDRAEQNIFESYIPKKDPLINHAPPSATPLPSAKAPPGVARRGPRPGGAAQRSQEDGDASIDGAEGAGARGHG